MPSHSPPDDAWVIGRFLGMEEVQVVLHYDGSRWSITKKVGKAAAESGGGIAALSPTDVWSVGTRKTDFYHGPGVIRHWDGAAWTVLDHPEPAGDDGLYDVDASSPDDVWAVGSTTVPHSPIHQVLIEHWNGHNW